MFSEIKSITGGFRTELIASSVKNKEYTFLVMNSGSVFTTLTGSNQKDIITNLNIGDNTTRQGVIIRLKNEETIKNITLSSGSVFGIIAG